MNFDFFFDIKNQMNTDDNEDFESSNNNEFDENQYYINELSEARKTYRNNVRELLADGEIEDSIPGIYYLNDDGYKLFQVIIHDTDPILSIYTCPWDKTKKGKDPREKNKECYREGYEYGENDEFYTELYFQTKYTQVFVPKEHNAIETENYIYADWMDGNSILVHVSTENNMNTYIYLGKTMYKFTSQEKFTNFYSPMFGNTSFPFGIGETNVYLFEERKYFPLVLWNKNSNPYEQYVDNNNSLNGKKWNKSNVKNINIRQIK